MSSRYAKCKSDRKRYGRGEKGDAIKNNLISLLVVTGKIIDMGVEILMKCDHAGR